MIWSATDAIFALDGRRRQLSCGMQRRPLIGTSEPQPGQLGVTLRSTRIAATCECRERLLWSGTCGGRSSR
jgi:hypothetical protein